jgi:5'-nucleotidase / UDP-sugar diphosphatase
VKIRIIPALIITAHVLIFPFSIYASEPDLVILHTNDMHGRIEGGPGLLGIPVISTIISQHRDAFPAVLVLDAGDAIHGRPVTDQLQGESAVAVMNAAGYDVMVPGNHDFNYGYQRLLELESLMEFDLVAANVFKDGELLFRPYVIRDFDGFTVGIFGLSTPDTYVTTHPRNVEGIEFGNPIEAAEKSVAALQEQGVDLIVALGHIGMEGDLPSTEILAEVEGIDLFVDGHSHSLLPEGELHNGTLVVQAHEYTKFLGRVAVQLTDNAPVLKASLICAEDAAGTDPDQKIVGMLQEFRAEVTRKILGN